MSEERSFESADEHAERQLLEALEALGRSDQKMREVYQRQRELQQVP